MASPGHYSSKLLDHLGLVAGMYDELGLALIDRVLPQDQDKRTVSLDFDVTFNRHIDGFDQPHRIGFTLAVAELAAEYPIALINRVKVFRFHPFRSFIGMASARPPP